MPDWETHLKIAKIDGIPQEIMKTVNEIIDDHHIMASKGELKGIPPELAEWELADIVIDSIADVTNERERELGLKAAFHHYILDYLQKSKQHFLLEIAKDEGLKGVTNYVKSISIASWKEMLREMGILEGKNVIIRDTQAILTGWYEINVDASIKLVRIKYEDSIAEYSFNLKPLSEQMDKLFYGIPIEEGQTCVRLKERLFRLLGYNALEELKEGIGSKYGILIGFNNGKKAYCGAKGLEVRVPEDVSKIEWIKVVSIEDRMENRVPRLLHEIIEAGDLGEKGPEIGEAGEHIVILGYGKINYQEDPYSPLREDGDSAQRA